MMRYTRSAVGLLRRQYKSVLKRCFLLNMGMFALMSSASAETVTSYDDLVTALAASTDADVTLNMSGGGIDLNGGSGITVGTNQNVTIENIGTAGTSSWTKTSRNITNHGQLAIDNVIFDNNHSNVSAYEVGTILYNSGSNAHANITNSIISNNLAETVGLSLWGGIIENNGSATIDLIQNVTFKDNFANAGQGAPHGGVIHLNNSTIKLIDNVTFEGNQMTGPTNQAGGAHGTAIDNNEGGRINKIANSTFKNNYIYRTGTAIVSGNYHASGGAIDNYNYIGEISNSLFEGNHTSTQSTSADGSGGAIMNVAQEEEGSKGYIGKIVNSLFINNYTESAGNANGGAIVSGNAAEATATSYIGEITEALFQGNHVRSLYSSASGGAIYNSYGTIGSISGDFIGNYASTSGTYAIGGAIRNFRGSIGDIIGNFTENYTLSTGSSYAHGGAIINTGNTSTEEFAVVKSITGNFVNNYAQGQSANGGAINNNGYGSIPKGIKGNFIGNYSKSVAGGNNSIGGAVINFGYIKIIDGDFTENYAESNGNDARGGAIANTFATATSSLGIDELRSAFTGNYALSTAAGYAQGGAIYNKANTKLGISKFSFSGNYAEAVSGEAAGGAIYNSGSITISEYGNVEGNHVLSASGAAKGGALYNSGTINGLTNATLSRNYALGSTAFGGALYADGTSNTNLIADGDVAQNAGVFTLKGNYISTDEGATKEYEGIYAGAATATLTFTAQNGGRFDLYDYMNGVLGYKVIFTGDESGVINLYNDVKNADVTTEKVAMNLIDEKISSYNFNSLTSADSAAWSFDIDISDDSLPEVDKIITSSSSTGKVKLSNLNFINGNVNDIIDKELVVQILKTPDDNLQLKNGLNELSGEYILSDTTRTYADNITPHILWTDDFATYEEETVITGELGLATSETTNDSIGITVKGIDVTTTPIDSIDTLQAINTFISDEAKTFTAASKNSTYTSRADAKETVGSLSVNGKGGTLDFSGYNGFEMSDGTEVTLKDLRAINAARLAYIEEGAVLNLEDVILSGNGALINNGTINLSGENNISDDITGTSANTNTTLQSLGGSSGGIINVNSDWAMTNTVSNNTINVNAAKLTVGASNLTSSVNLTANKGSEIAIGNERINIKEAKFAAGSELSILVKDVDDYGQIKAESFAIEEGSGINITFGNDPLKGEKTGEVSILALSDGSDIDNNNFIDKFTNNLFNFKRKADKSGIYVVTWDKTPQDVSKDNDGNKTQQDAADPLADEIPELYELAQNDGKGFNEALSAIAPMDAPIVQENTIKLNDKIYYVVNGNLSGRQQGLSSGDELGIVSLWADTYYGKSKLDNRANYYGFETESKGFIDTAKGIRETDDSTSLVFLTTSEEYRPDAFSLFATSYLIKPCAKEQVFRTLDHIFRLRTSAEPCLSFSFDRQEFSLPFGDIVSLETDGNYLAITDQTGRIYRTRMTFSTAMERLDSRFLILIRGVTVNMDRVAQILDGQCRMQSGALFPLQVKRQAELREQWLNYKFAKIREDSAGMEEML